MKLHYKKRKEKELLLLQREYNNLLRQGLEIYDYDDNPCGYIVRFGNTEQCDDEDTQDAYNIALYTIDGCKHNFLESYYGKTQKEIEDLIANTIAFYSNSRTIVLKGKSIVDLLSDLSIKLDYINIDVSEDTTQARIPPMFFSGVYYNIDAIREKHLNREKTLAHQAEIKRLETLLKPHFKRLTKSNSHKPYKNYSKNDN